MISSPFQTVRARLTLWNVFVLALVLLALGGILRVSVEVNLMHSVDGELQDRVRHHQEFWAHASSRVPPGTPPAWEWKRPGSSNGGPSRRPRGNNQPARPPAAAGPASPPRDHVSERVFSIRGEQLFPPGGERPLDLAAFARAARGEENFSAAYSGKERMRLFSAPLRWQKRVAGVVQVAYSLADVDRAIGNLNGTLLTLIPVGLAAAALGGLFLTGRMLRPLRQVNQAVNHIGAEDLSRRLPVLGQDEFSTLAANFNQMLKRLEHAFEQQRRFTADASHELRTPLTVVKIRSSRALSDPDLSDKQRRAWEATDRAAGLMSAIVQDLLLLARSDDGQLTPNLQPVSLRDAIEAALEAVHLEGGPLIIDHVPPDLTVLGETALLTRLFANLFKNAAQHTPESGHICVQAQIQGNRVLVTVEDTGAGISPEHLPHVLERFYRVDAARSRAEGGTGLGLPICRSIVEAHGGELQIQSVLEVGTTVSFTLKHVGSLA